MIPMSLSATALNTAELCLARYHAEHIIRGRGESNSAASTGSAVHGALEMFVKAVHLSDQPKEPTLELLLMYFRLSYTDVFASSDYDTDEYADGVEMLTKWFERTSFEGRQVLSCEVKTNFMVKTSAGEIPLNYIWDRCDKIGEREYEIVDYKTNRWGLRPEDLKKKIQARVYGLAGQIQFPDAKRIWVRFDLLRHDSVAIVFTREENIATWKFIKALAERIIAQPDDDPKNPIPETLNPECRFCVRKQSCKALERNVAVGGIFSIANVEEAIDQRAAMEYQQKALSAAIAELDTFIIEDAKKRDILEFESEMNRLHFGFSQRRAVDAERAEMVVGSDKFEEYGGKTITMKQFEKLCKDPDLTAAQKKMLNSLIYTNKGEPRVKVEPRNAIDED